MSIRSILLWPDRRLQRRCAPVPEGTDVAALVRDMFDTMYDAPGRGLAAPQIGEMVRVFVMDVTWKEGERTPIACINPEILSASEKLATNEEGCLSIPGVTASVARPEEITLGYRDVAGAWHEDRLSGFAAACAQHELDHLDGRVTFDRVPPEARADLLAAYEGTRI